MYDCIIFDVDGTLIDTEKAVLKTYRKVLIEELGRDFDDRELYFVLGLPLSVALTELGITNIESVSKKWNIYLKEFNEYIRLFPGIESVLRNLNQLGIITGIVTSKTSVELRDDFGHFGLMNYLRYIVCADDTEHHKPNPDPLLKFIEISRISPKKAIYIGDTVYDMICARDSGLDFALADWGEKSSLEVDAKYKINDPKDLLKLLLPDR